MRVEVNVFLSCFDLRWDGEDTCREGCAQVDLPNPRGCELFFMPDKTEVLFASLRVAGGEMCGKLVDERGFLLSPVMLVACSSCEWEVVIFAA